MKFRVVMLALVIAILPLGMCARVHEVKTNDKLRCLLQKYELSLVCFNSNQSTCCQSKTKCAVKNVSNIKRYKNAGIGFIQVNIAQDELEDFIGDMSMPTIILFAGDKPVTDKQGCVVQLTGDLSCADVQKFIELHAGIIIDTNLEQQQGSQSNDWFNYYNSSTYAYCGPCSWGPYFYGYTGYWF